MRHYILFSFVFLAIFSTFVNAQLGQQAGPLVFNVTLGGSQTLNYTILNGGDSPIGFRVVLPVLNTIPHNETPTVSISPMNGTLAPHSQQVIHVTVYMPSKNKPGLVWNGGITPGTSGIQVIEVSPSQVSTGMGATVYAGVLKSITIYSAKPPLNIMLIVGIVAIAVIVAISLVIYYYKVLLSAKARKAEARRKELAAIAKAAKARKAKARKKAKPKARAKKGKKTSRRGRRRR
ncbi:MAG: hypothetical protein ACP5JN_03880 [Candidatus Micrarchaeia archaeon]